MLKVLKTFVTIPTKSCCIVIVCSYSFSKMIQCLCCCVTGFNVETVEHKGMLMTFWDLAGQQKVRSLWSQHYSSVDALWFVVDSFDQERIAQAKQELWAILNDKKLRKDAMLLVLANKQDLNGALSPDQLQKELDLSTIVDRPWYIIGCCAQSGDGISSALDWIYFQMENKSKSS